MNSFKVLRYCCVLLLCSSASLAQNHEQKIEALIKKMTLEEKVAMIHASSSFTSGGVPRLGIPEITMSDGPHGVRPEHGRDWVMDTDADDAGTYLPTGIGLASTWNKALGYEYGKVLGSEANYRGKDIILGPGVNIIRSPLNGRNFEYFSEDPYLTSRMAVGYIQGVQSQGVSACVKHYAANNEEIDRGTVDVRMSERALREIYLPAFEASVKEADVNAVMGAYNKFRGQYTTHHQYLVNDILKGEWGFKGILMSDWGSVHNTKEALENGTDLEMGTDLVLMYSSVSQTEAGNSSEKNTRNLYDRFFLADSAIQMVKQGIVPESLVDDKVRRILRLMYKTSMLEGKRMPGAYNTREHQQVALKVAEESIILLKNKNVLPVNKDRLKRIAVIGENANRENAMGGGSSQVRAKYEITPLQGIKNLVNNSAEITYARGYKIERNASVDNALIEEAVDAAKHADLTVLVVGWTHGYNYSKWSDNAYDAEGTDKPDMILPFGQDALISAVLKVNPNTVVVSIGGGPMEMPWINDANAIVQAWYPGMEGGNAIAKVLFGEVNPSGKLPMTFPKKLGDSPAHKLGDFPGKNGVANYNEEIYVGYRFFDKENIEPEFPFGHGLSYSQFSYKDLKVSPASGHNLKVSLTLKNTGKRDGAEVPQVYVSLRHAEEDRPPKELKSFDKIFLKSGESRRIEMLLPKDAFRVYSTKANEWVDAQGEVEVLVGASSRDIRLKKLVSKR